MADKELKEFAGYKLECGLWWDEYTRIFSPEGNLRIVETSNYPRVVEQVYAPTYDEDTEFMVTEADVNMEDEVTKEKVYWDSKDKKVKVGEMAMKYKGIDLALGGWERWLKDKNPIKPRSPEITYHLTHHYDGRPFDPRLEI